MIPLSGGALIPFDLQGIYNLSTLHFWNYFTEDFDVDDIDLTFKDSSNAVVGTMLDVNPSLGTNLLTSQDIAASFQNVRFVNVFLAGTNAQVDFNNLGFTGELVPEPGSFVPWCLMLLSLVMWRGARRLKPLSA